MAPLGDISKTYYVGHLLVGSAPQRLQASWRVGHLDRRTSIRHPERLFPAMAIGFVHVRLFETGVRARGCHEIRLQRQTTWGTMVMLVLVLHVFVQARCPRWLDRETLIFSPQFDVDSCRRSSECPHNF